jgi:hypothetical protein
MAKIFIQVQLKTDAGAALGTIIPSGDQPNLTAAKAAVQAVIDQRVSAATQNAADLSAADAAFNS